MEQLRAALADRYDLRREVARGGMGTVFEATDLKHRRSVAIKVLDPELASVVGTRRFQTEVETAARLTHPHIIPLHDSGEAGGLFYYVMPLVAGESLRQRLTRERQLPIDEAVRITCEIADALRYAHDHGLIHRDIKPENVLLSEGHALVFDFGIARLTDTASGVTGPSTSTFAVAGTPTYMSPEQLTGAALDGRSDQYSLACVLYELLAGQPPFVGSTADTVALQHRTLEPRPVTALRPTATSPTPPAGTPTAGRVMLAVLPLQNRSSDPDQDFFTDGMTEELITQLGRLQPKRLGVIARTSALRYKGTEKSVEEIGRELNVQYLLEGSVRRAGERIRITAQLIQVSDQTNLWAESYDRRVADVFDLQSDVAETVAKALVTELLPSEATPAPQSLAEPAANSEAFEAYLKGRYYWAKRTPEALWSSLRWFERAVAMDPGFARAHAGVADVYRVLPTYGLMEPGEGNRKAEAAGKRALELAPGLIEARATIAAERAWTSREESLRELLNVVEADPSYVPALLWYGVMHTTTGRFEGAIRILERARGLDPLSAVIHYCLGFAWYFWGKNDRAIAQFREAIELEPTYTAAIFYLVLCQVASRDAEGGLQILDRLDPKLADASDMIGARAYVLGVLGRGDEARAAIRKLEERSKNEYVSWEWFGYGYMGLGDADAVIALLERTPVIAIVARMRLERDPVFAPLRAHAKFAKVCPPLS